MDSVVFRKFPEGDIIALFPNQIETKEGHINSYQHVGQHGGASPELINELEKAHFNEYQDLANELLSIGYDLQVII
jgi:hypothetical protein